MRQEREKNIKIEAARRLRAGRGLSLEEIGKELGCTRQNVSLLLAGETLIKSSCPVCFLDFETTNSKKVYCTDAHRRLVMLVGLENARRKHARLTERERQKALGLLHCGKCGSWKAPADMARAYRCNECNNAERKRRRDRLKVGG